jgi:hypothetical protein
MKNGKTRHQFYLPDSHTQRLNRLASRPGASKSAVVIAALDTLFEHEGAREVDERFGPRLDRQSRAAERTERKVDALTELVGVFVQHQLTMSAHQPAFDEATAQLGRLRFNQLLDLVEQRLARGGMAARFTTPSTQPGGNDDA